LRLADPLYVHGAATADGDVRSDLGLRRRHDMYGPWLVAAFCGAVLFLASGWSGWLAYAIRVLALLALSLAGIVLIVGSIRKRGS
jgi:hypothetical protein